MFLHALASDDAMRTPGIIKDNWDKGDYGLGQIAHFLLQGSVKKTGKGCSDYFIFEEDTCRWAKVDEGRVKSVVVEAMEEALRDVDLWIATQSAQRRLQGGDAKMRVANLDLKKREVVSLIRYIRSNRGVTNVMVFAGPLLMDETFEQRLDSNRHLIGIKGGSVVDLRTGQKRQRVAEDMVHNELDVVYDNNNDNNHATTTMMTNAARAEWMHRIIQKIMGGDEAMAKFIQRLLGYGITGEVREEIFPIWTGSGRNGKGLLTQALQQLLGAYYKEMNCAIISDSRACSNLDAERAKLIGARLAVFNELKHGEKLKTNEVQLLTGGDGFPVKAVYKNPVTVMPKHLAILVTNQMPEMSEVIVAMTERLLAIHELGENRYPLLRLLHGTYLTLLSPCLFVIICLMHCVPSTFQTVRSTYLPPTLTDVFVPVFTAVFVFLVVVFLDPPDCPDCPDCRRASFSVRQFKNQLPPLSLSSLALNPLFAFALAASQSCGELYCLCSMSFVPAPQFLIVPVVILIYIYQHLFFNAPTISGTLSLSFTALI
jgi:P4 family phage/plasmid primase-like protien